MIRFRLICLSAAALVVASAPSGAQVEMSAAAPIPVALLEGQVVDSLTGEPIEGVLISMDSGQRTFTDGRGRFTFSDLAEGKRLFAMMTADCRITWGQVTVVTRFPRDVQFRLPPAFGAMAEEEKRVVEERQRTSGRRLESHEIDRMNASNVLELVRRMAPGMVGPMQGDPGDVSPLVASRGRSLGTTDPPVVLIDGVRTPGAEGTLSTMRPSEVSVLEVQPGAAAGWEYGSSGASGVIKITLRRGLATGAEERPEATACVVPAFPGG